MIYIVKNAPKTYKTIKTNKTTTTARAKKLNFGVVVSYF